MVVGAAVHVNAGSLYDYIKKCIIGALPLLEKAAFVGRHRTNRPKCRLLQRALPTRGASAKIKQPYNRDGDER